MAREVKVPELGENIDEAEVLRVLVSAGDRIEADAPVIELGTDKASLEMPASEGGVVADVLVKEGDVVTPGQAVLALKEEGAAAEEEAATEEEEEGAAEAEPEPETEPETEAEAEPEPEPEREPARGRRRDEVAARSVVPAGPATRRFAREVGVELGEVEFEGERITREDVKRHLRGKRRTRREKMSRLRRTVARRLSQAWREIPHVTHHEQVDVTALEAARREIRAREPELPLTVTALAIKAVVTALRDNPRFNASVDGDELVYHGAVHIGVAVDTERGLLVPVIRDAEGKTTRAIAQETAQLAERARAGKLREDELRGSTFSVTNLGGIGGVAFTPIINPPEVAVLGISRMHPAPTGDGERLVLPLSLSYDHRVIDGADAARFVRTLGTMLSSPLAMLLDC